MSLSAKGREFFDRSGNAREHGKNALLEIGLAAGFGYTALKGAGVLPKDFDIAMSLYMAARAPFSVRDSRYEWRAAVAARDEAERQITVEYLPVPEEDQGPEQKAA